MSITYFVDNVLGVDSNVGYDIDAPLRTVARALALCRSGYDDIIFIMSTGTAIAETITITKDYISIRGENARVEIAPAVTISGDFVSLKTLTVSSISLDSSLGSTIEDVRIVDAPDYGIDIDAGCIDTHILEGVTYTGSVTGDIQDLGTDTYIVGSLDEIAFQIDHIHKEVYIDTELPDVGDGSLTHPFNDLGLALDYAETHQIYNLVVHSDIVIDRNLKNFIIRGIGTPEVDCDGKNLKNSEFSRVKLKGSYSDQIIVEDSVLLTGSFLNGIFSNCVLNGLSTCIDGGTVLMKDCASNVAGLGRPTISMNAAGTTKLSVRSWDGGLNIEDCNAATDEVTVGLSTGSLAFLASCTDGTMVARGVGVFVDSTAGATVQNEIVFNSTIATAVDAQLVDDFATVASDIAALNNFNPALDTVANVTVVGTTTTNTDMRGTDGANTVTPNVIAPATPADISALNNFNPGTDTVANVTLVATTTTNSDMRGTDNANTTVPDTAIAIRTEIDTNSTRLATIAGDTTTNIPAQISTLNDFDGVAISLLVDEIHKVLGLAAGTPLTVTEDGNITVGGISITAVTSGTTPNRSSIQTRV